MARRNNIYAIKKLCVINILTILYFIYQRFEIRNLHQITQNFIKRSRCPNIFERQRVSSLRQIKTGFSISVRREIFQLNLTVVSIILHTRNIRESWNFVIFILLLSLFFFVQFRTISDCYNADQLLNYIKKLSVIIERNLMDK